MATAHDKPMLCFITCGSVDDGKSTLIGRLLLEANCIFDDQMQAIASDSKKFGTQGDRTDLALLVDGLQAEREQGITIDVAYRFLLPTSANLWWPTHPAMSSTRATWQPALPQRNSPSFCSTHARVC